MHRPPLTALIAGLFVLPAQAADPAAIRLAMLDPIVVTATRIDTLDTEATYAAEVHTRAMIEQSGATSLYDYLAQHSSVYVLPSYGNRHTPKLDMRGYGIGDGYQNIVVSLDGRRLSNIDMTAPLLGVIALADVERIEISKGSGAVLNGDGALAGAIAIQTRRHQGVSLQAGAGSHGLRTGSVSAGVARERYSLDASAEYAGADGTSQRDPSGHRDESSLRNWRGGVEARPGQGIKLSLDGASSRIDTRYVSALSQAQFEADPSQVGSNPWVVPVNAYSQQRLAADLWRLGADYEPVPNWRLNVVHGQEDKRLDNVNASYASSAEYDYRSDELGLRHQGERFALAAGVQAFDGRRLSFGNRTAKDNTSLYVQGQYLRDDLTISAGVRRERVAYRYQPASGSVLTASHDLAAWDLGVNRRLDPRLSVFANFDRAFQAPDVDRFFVYDFGTSSYTFNGFIQPAISRTFTLGANHVTDANRLKLSLFHASLDNEIYYRATSLWTGYNTNLDKSHKYGLELQDHWRFGPAFGINLNYAWTQAIIDREADAAGAFDGKELPGVPRHSLSLGLAWQPSPATQLLLSHVWRSDAWVSDDFANSATQKQAAYQATDLSLRYRQGQAEWRLAVENLFEQKNGLWVRTDAIYPVNFTRNWRLGVKAEF
jgi:iron complex outermembrane receptor protein